MSNVAIRARLNVSDINRFQSTITKWNHSYGYRDISLLNASRSDVTSIRFHWIYVDTIREPTGRNDRTQVMGSSGSSGEQKISEYVFEIFYNFLVVEQPCYWFRPTFCRISFIVTIVLTAFSEDEWIRYLSSISSILLETKVGTMFSAPLLPSNVVQFWASKPLTKIVRGKEFLLDETTNGNPLRSFVSR